MQTFNNTKMIGGLVLLVIALVYFYGRTGGKKRGEQNAVIIAPIPNGQIDPSLDVDGLAKRLYNQLKGFSWPNDIERKTVLYELISLNHSEFVAVYNTFNQNYGEGDSLRVWIEDERWLGDDLEGRLTARFQFLNLS